MYTFGGITRPALGCIVDGVPPGLALTEADMQADLDRRRRAHPAIPHQRRGPDQSEFCQGYLGKTTRNQYPGC